MKKQQLKKLIRSIILETTKDPTNHESVDYLLSSKYDTPEDERFGYWDIDVLNYYGADKYVRDLIENYTQFETYFSGKIDDVTKNILITNHFNIIPNKILRAADRNSNTDDQAQERVICFNEVIIWIGGHLEIIPDDSLHDNKRESEKHGPGVIGRRFYIKHIKSPQELEDWISGKSRNFFDDLISYSKTSKPKHMPEVEDDPNAEDPLAGWYIPPSCKGKSKDDPSCKGKSKDDPSHTGKDNVVKKNNTTDKSTEPDDTNEFIKNYIEKIKIGYRPNSDEILDLYNKAKELKSNKLMNLVKLLSTKLQENIMKKSKLSELIRHITRHVVKEYMNGVTDPDINKNKNLNPDNTDVNNDADEMTPGEKAKAERDKKHNTRVQLSQKKIELDAERKQSEFYKKKVEQSKRYNIPRINKDIQSLSGARI